MLTSSPLQKSEEPSQVKPLKPALPPKKSAMKVLSPEKQAQDREQSEIAFKAIEEGRKFGLPP
jgi:hypothetical protein